MINYKCIKGFMILAVMLTPFSIQAGQGDDEDGNDLENTDVVSKNKSGRPKAPSRKNIVVNVEDGFMTVKFRQPEGHASMEIKDLSTGFTLSFEFDSAVDFHHFLPSSFGSYRLTIQTEQNNTYNFDL